MDLRAAGIKLNQVECVDQTNRSGMNRIRRAAAPSRRGKIQLHRYRFKCVDAPHVGRANVSAQRRLSASAGACCSSARRAKSSM